MQPESALRGKRGQGDGSSVPGTGGRAGSGSRRGSADEPDGETRTAGGGGTSYERRGGAAAGRRGEGCSLVRMPIRVAGDGGGAFDLEKTGVVGE